MCPSQDFWNSLNAAVTDLLQPFLSTPSNAASVATTAAVTATNQTLTPGKSGVITTTPAVPAAGSSGVTKNRPGNYKISGRNLTNTLGISNKVDVSRKRDQDYANQTIHKVSGKNMTENNTNTGGGISHKIKFASESTRTNTLDDVVGGGDGANMFGANNEYDFSVHPDADHGMKSLMGQVEQFNSRLDLQSEMPSTRNVNRFNSQNKGY